MGNHGPIVLLTCAWILWEISSPTGSLREWTHDKIAAEPTHQACQQRAELAMQRRAAAAQLIGWAVTRGASNRLTFTKGQEVFTGDFSCWPDTVDPRK
jgi:hypothetical protein